MRPAAAALAVLLATPALAQERVSPLAPGTPVSDEPPGAVEEADAPDFPELDAGGRAEVPEFEIPGPNARIFTTYEAGYGGGIDGGADNSRFQLGAGVGLDSGFIGLDGRRPAGIEDVTGPLIGLAATVEANYLAFDVDQLGPQGAAAGVPEDLLDHAYTASFSPRLTVALSRESSLAVGGIFTLGWEEGAEPLDGFVPGGIIGYRRQLADGVVVLVGVGAFLELDDDVFVVPLIQLEVDRGVGDFFIESQGLGGRVGFRFDESLTASVGARFTGNDFRLASDDRIAQERRVAVDAGLGYELGESLFLYLRAGSDVWGNYEILEEDGSEIFDVETDPSFRVTAGVTYRF